MFFKYKYIELKNNVIYKTCIETNILLIIYKNYIKLENYKFINK